MSENIIITGSNGFIAQNLIGFLKKKSKKNIIIGIDYNYNSKLKKNCDYFYKSDLSKYDKNLPIKIKTKLNNNFDIYFWHLAANSDIQKGSKNKSIDYNNTYLSTKNSLKYAEELKVNKYIFTSSSAVFGNSNKKLKESNSNLNPISNYGKYKLKSEKIIFDYSKKNNRIFFYIFRLPNVIGNFLTHGILFDFIKKISKNKFTLKVLGNGSQTKPYLHVNDLIKGFLLILKRSNKKYNLFHIGPYDEGISVKNIVKIFISKFNHKINVTYEKANIGWKGDVNKYVYDLRKIKNNDWHPKYSSKQAIKKTLNDYFK